MAGQVFCLEVVVVKPPPPSHCRFIKAVKSCTHSSC